MKKHLSRKTRKRITAICAAISMCTTTLVNLEVGTDPSLRAKGEGNQLNSLILEMERTLTYKGERTYAMTLDASAYLAKKQMPKSRMQSDDGYFTAPFSGDYLIQLWGGKGGNGADRKSVFNTYPGGTGGAGGYVGGVIHLEQGQTLLYNIGTNGERTQSTLEGGGINGDGGNHGDIGSFAVGGGGGYSAVYLYDAGEFGGAIRPSEADRMTKYIMIAGGGGGGGAGDIFAEKRANGGAAGIMGSSASGVLSAVDAPVAGTYYAGSDGISSGGNSEYVGKGGTFVPGGQSETILGMVNSYGIANDWFCTANPDAIGGGGGAGNLRGGSGGAGYCGGSGGVMVGLLLPDDVGGGGGGSSFISDVFVLNSSKAEGEMLSANPAGVGGCCYIKYLDSNATYDAYDNVTITIPKSEYFDITHIDVNNMLYRSDTRAEIGQNTDWSHTDDPTTGAVTLSGINISPDENSVQLHEATITLTFRAKDTFAGGNFVPLLTEDNITLTDENDVTTPFAAQEKLSYVNVPLNYELQTKSIWSEAGESVAVTELYNDAHNAGLTKAPFTAQGVYKVNDSDGLTTVSPTTSTNYSISYDISILNGKFAEIGPIQEAQTLSGTATINILEDDVTYITPTGTPPAGGWTPETADVTLHVKRTLDYTDCYETKITVWAETKRLSYTPAVEAASQTWSANGTYPVPTTGWYLLEARGGDGGKGQKADSHDGGAGGQGGSISGYVYLTAGEELTVIVGTNGDSPADIPSTGFLSRTYGSGGGGGTYSAICIGSSNYLLAAGGGGGGGGGYHSAVGGIAGEIGSKGSDVVNTSTPLSTFDAGKINGEQGVTASDKKSGKGGAAGQNYSSIAASFDFANHPEYLQPENAALTAPSVRITRLGTASDYDAKATASTAALADIQLSLNGAVSDYFNLAQGSNNLTIQNFSLDGIKAQPDEEHHIVYAKSGETTIIIKETPINGFLGGNDVPLFSTNPTLTFTNPANTVATNVNMKSNAALNLANVAIPTPTFSASDHTVIYDTEVTVPDVLLDGGSFDINDYSNKQKAYVNFTANPVAETIHATETASYDICYVLSPSTPPEVATAKVIPAVSAQSYQQNATLFVNCTVTTNLSHLTSDGDATVPCGEEYACKLTPETGYLLPTSITVERNGTALLADSDYSYDRLSGDIVIPAEKVAGNIEIHAEARVKTYDLIFQYATDKDNLVYEKRTYSYPAGTAFPAAAPYADWTAWANDLAAELTDDYQGYQFEWDFQLDEGQESLDEMPARNHFVFGGFSKIPRILQITYVMPSGSSTPAPAPYQDFAYDGDTLVVPTPAIEGYIPSQASVNVTFNGANVEQTVTYEAINNRIEIHYIHEDGSEVAPTRTGTASVETGEQEFVSPPVEGYTPDQTSVVVPTGGKYAIVTYHPNAITVQFDAVGGSLEANANPRVAYYGKDFGVSEHDENYNYLHSALPIPVKIGYTFDGWFSGDTQITEKTICYETAAMELTAHWTANVVTMTVHYQKDNEDVPFFTDYAEFLPDTSPRTYTVLNDKKPAHYSLVNDAQTTIAVGMVNKTVYVMYKGDDCNLTVHYVMSDGTTAPADYHYANTYEFGSQYSEEVPFPDGVENSKIYTLSPNVISGKMDAVDKVVNVTLIKTDEVIKVTVAWECLTYTVDTMTWNPNDHQYYADAADLTPLSGDQKITVTNESTVPITAAFSYEKNVSFKKLDCAFKKNGQAVNSIVIDKDNDTTDAIGVSDSVSVSLSGEFPVYEEGTYRAGTCKVAITAGGVPTAPSGS